MTTVEEAYADVERLTRARARNFAYGIMLLPKWKRRAIAAIYAFAREVDDVADDPGLDDATKRRAARGTAGAASTTTADEAMFVALADARRRYPIPSAALDDLVDGGLQDTRADAVRDVRRSRGVLPAGRGGRRCRVRRACTARDEPKRAETLGVALQLINIIRDVAEDWSLGRVYLPQDELARFGVSEEDIGAGRCTTEWRALMAHQAQRAREHLAEGRTLLPRLDRRSAACVAAFANLYSVTLGPDRGARLRRIRRAAAAVAADKAPDCGSRTDPAVNVAVVGGGLAGLAAALELADQGHGVTLYEARPTLGGAVQTLPEREGDPEPPPDNGQHIALGCFTEYLRFLERIGEGQSYRRLSLDLPVIAEDGRTASIGRSASVVPPLPPPLARRPAARGERRAPLAADRLQRADLRRAAPRPRLPGRVDR